MAYIYQVTIGANTYPIAASLYGTCSTAVGTAAKTVTLSSFDNYRTGIILAVKFTNGNSAAAISLNVNSKGVKNVYVDGAASTVDNFTLSAGAVALFSYDGTQFNAIGIGQDTKAKYVYDDEGGGGESPIVWAPSDIVDGAADYIYYGDWTIIPSTGALSIGSVSTDGTNFYEIGAAAARGIGTVTTGSTGLVTGNDVAIAIEQSATGGVAYKGALNGTSGSDDYWQTKMLNTALTAGWYYVATGAFSISTQDVETGDMVFVNTSGTYTTAAALAAAIDIVQGELDAMTETDIDNAIANA